MTNNDQASVLLEYLNLLHFKFKHHKNAIPETYAASAHQAIVWTHELELTEEQQEELEYLEAIWEHRSGWA